MEATTRGDNKIKKEIFMGMKKACQFNLPTSYEFVFDHGYAGDTYGAGDIVNVFNATTANYVNPSPWSGSCTIDMIIYQTKSANKSDNIYFDEYGECVPLDRVT
jgi:hypothetical protein